MSSTLDSADANFNSTLTRSGFVALAGRPNVGKSTLMNAFVDADVAITSARPETTRKAIRGILTRDTHQIVFVDTPGIHRPRTLLGKRLNAITDEQLTAVDIVLFLTPADEKLGPGDKRILEHLKTLATNRIKLLAVATKIDKVKQAKLFAHLDELQKLHDFDAIIPVSGLKDDNLHELERVLVENLPTGDFLYAPDQLTDESWQSQVAEAVREAALEKLHQELPHSLMVQVNERIENIIYVNLYVERSSQKGIILGHRGENISYIRHTAIKKVREMLGKDVQLSLQVKIAKDWQSDTKLLERFGF